MKLKSIVSVQVPQPWPDFGLVRTGESFHQPSMLGCFCSSFRGCANWDRRTFIRCGWMLLGLQFDPFSCKDCKKSKMAPENELPLGFQNPFAKLFSPVENQLCSSSFFFRASLILQLGNVRDFWREYIRLSMPLVNVFGHNWFCLHHFQNQIKDQQKAAVSRHHWRSLFHLIVFFYHQCLWKFQW